MIKVMVTGATGYIGSNLIRFLLKTEKYSITAAVRSESDLTPLKPFEDLIDIRKLSPKGSHISAIVADSSPDAVVHLAALQIHKHTIKHLKELMDSNIVFGTELADAMAANGVKSLVNTGSFWEYMDGDGVYRPVNLYAATKYAFVDLLRYYHEAKGLNVLTLSLFNVYGPNHPRMKLFQLLRDSSTSGEPVNLTPGRQVVDMVYIDDVSEAYDKAVEYLLDCDRPVFDSIDIGSGVGHSLREIVSQYEKISDLEPKVRWGGIQYREREVMYGVADLQVARKTLGWEPAYDLEGGITAMLKAEQPAAEKKL